MEKEQNSVMLKEDTSVGTVRIADDVVAMIASIAATEVEGVAPVGGNVAKQARGVKVEIRNGKVRVNVSAAIKYGYHIPEVSQQLQNKVKASIENMTGLTCNIVNVQFSGVIIK